MEVSILVHNSNNTIQNTAILVDCNVRDVNGVHEGERARHTLAALDIKHVDALLLSIGERHNENIGRGEGGGM